MNQYYLKNNNELKQHDLELVNNYELKLNILEKNKIIEIY